MRKIVSLLSLTLLGTTAYYAQTGINTPDPGSTLHVNGSFAAQYRAVSTATYAMNATDYHVSYTGTGNATFSLPTAIAGTGNFKGRLYTIKNNTTSTITINPAASETIGGNTNIALAANQSVQIINTGLTGAAPTWEVIAYNNTSSGGIGCVPDYIFATLSANQEGVAGDTNINFNQTKAGSGIAMTNGVFTLKAGKTYELEANLLATNFTEPNIGVLVGNWVDASTSAAIASTTLEFYPTTYNSTPNNGISTSKAYITAVSDINVAFRITSATGSAQIRGNQSYASIKQLNACGGGGGSTPVVTNVTASNGLNASGNDVKLGGTLSQATDIATAGNNLTVSGTGNVGIGATAPTSKLEVNSGTANTSGLKLTNLTSSTPIGVGQTIGVDANGNVITMANATAATISTAEVASSNGADYPVSDLGWATVSGTPQTMIVPTGGKAVFINFMLGIDYVNIPSGSGFSYYTATLYIDNQPTNTYLTAQENGAGTQAQFNLSTVKFLNAGSHTLDIRMRRTMNGGVASGTSISCRPISMSFNASYIN